MKVVDKEISVHAAVLNFFKAFDKISHSLLINKLCSSGISSLVIKRIDNLFTDGYQKVVISGVSSNSLTVSSGVLQDSVLGPSLSLIYVNDIKDFYIMH